MYKILSPRSSFPTKIFMLAFTKVHIYFYTYSYFCIFTSKYKHVHTFYLQDYNLTQLHIYLPPSTNLCTHFCAHIIILHNCTYSYLQVHVGARVFTTNFVGYSRTSLNLFSKDKKLSKYNFSEIFHQFLKKFKNACRSVSIAAFVPWLIWIVLLNVEEYLRECWYWWI